MHNKACFWSTFTGNHLTRSKNTCDLQKRTFILLFRHFEPNWVRKSYFQSDLRFYGLLDNKLTINYEYSRINRKNLPLPTLIKLSEKLQIFWAIFFAFLESTIDIQCFEIKMSLIAQVFLKLFTSRYVLV